MKNKSRQIALSSMMTALGAAAMLLGGVIPLATFCCPAIAGLALLPILRENGSKMALGSYVAIAALSLILSADKESALLFAFLGYYPVLKRTLDRIPSALLRILSKLSVFNLAAGIMMLCAAFVFNMQALVAEYAEMTAAALVAFILLANVTMLLYDRMLKVMAAVYEKKLRPVLMRGA